MSGKEAFQEAFRGDETHVAFGILRGTGTEVVGPMKPLAVQFGEWTWNFHGVFPMITLNFNKYRPDLPPWDAVLEVALATHEDAALAKVANDLGEAISGHLKTVHVGCSDVSWGLDDGSIVSKMDVYERRHSGAESKRDTGDFKVDEVLE